MNFRRALVPVRIHLRQAGQEAKLPIVVELINPQGESKEGAGKTSAKGNGLVDAYFAANG